MFVAAWGAAGFGVAAVACIGVAWVVYRARPRRIQNRLLGVALFIDGLTWGLVAARIAASDPVVAASAWTTQFVFLILSALAYLAFLGTLETPVTAPVRGRRGWIVLVALALASLFTFFAWPSWFVPGTVVPGPGPWRWVWTEFGPGMAWIIAAHSVVLLVAIIAAVDAWRRRHPGSPMRSRAGAYAAAFGVRDLVLLVDWWILLAHRQRGITPLESSWGVIEILLVPGSILVFSGLISYGILKHHLFDIDLKIKWTLRRSTLVAVFVAFFFVVSESTALFLGERWGPYLGIVAAGLLLFALAPLQRIADRFADTAMPQVQDTTEYRLVRKGEVYRAAVEEALGDGVLSDKDRNVLAALSDQLALPALEARRIESDVVRGRI